MNLGLYPTNVFQFTMLQEVLAKSLNVQIGKILFYSDSLHCYLDKETMILVKNVLSHEPIDIYEYIQPTSMHNYTLEKLDELLLDLWFNENKYRKENFDIDLVSNHPFWQSVELMLKCYCMRKHKQFNGSIEEISYIPADDFRVMAYQYSYNKGTEFEKKWINQFLEREKWDININKFIRGG